MFCKCLEDGHMCFRFFVDAVYVMSERHSSVVGHTKYGEVVGAWERRCVWRRRLSSRRRITVCR